MNPILVKTLELVLALSILVFIHELGHYTFSRIFGVWVEKFYLFFNPWFTVVKWKAGKYMKWLSHGKEMGADEEARNDNENKRSWRATEYGIGWLPLGGYCSISGMIDESMNTEQMKQPAKPWEFRSKPAWQRLLIMVGGVLFNFLLAVLIYIGIAHFHGEDVVRFADATQGMEFCDAALKVGFQNGDILLAADGKPLEYLNDEAKQQILHAESVTVLRNHRDTVTIHLDSHKFEQLVKDAGDPLMAYRLPVFVDETSGNGGAAQAGLRHGDEITAIEGEMVSDYPHFTQMLMNHKGQDVTISLQRNGEKMNVKAKVDDDGKLGFRLLPYNKAYKSQRITYGLLASIPHGVAMGWDRMTQYVASLKMIFTPEGAKSLGGFGAIGSIFPSSWDWPEFWAMTAFLSIILAVMNILPIPALDGGYVLFLLIEMITGHKFGEKFMERAVTIGMVLLIALLVFANGNDIYRYIFK